MKLQPASSAGYEWGTLTVRKLPPEIAARAAGGLGWISLISAVTSVAFTLIKHFLQPEFAVAWQHPVLRLASLCVFLLSIAFFAIVRCGLVSKARLLDLGLVFQVAIAFACGLFEGAAYRDPNAVVTGISGIAVWMMLCGRLMPNPPLKSAISAALCVLMWPLGYSIDLKIFGYEPMSLSRLLGWMLPLCIVAVWMYVLNIRTLSYYASQQRAEDVGSYVLSSMIGKGGMGEVWRARHKTLARDAAIKVIRPQILSSSGHRQNIRLTKRFEREAQVTAQLRSPHTVALYDFGQSKTGELYYVMELIDGVDLQTLVDRFGAMEPARVVHILIQAAESLEEAHRAGLVHRDINPRNMMLGKLGLQYDFLKVLDFGLVKALVTEESGEDGTSTEGAAIGTPAYMSPEVALASRDIDGRADLYSLGCTAYFLLTGQQVFGASTLAAYAIAHLHRSPPAMRCERPIPAGLERIVMQLLEKEPANRIQSARDLARRLRHLSDVGQWSTEQAEGWWERNCGCSGLASADSSCLTNPCTTQGAV